MVGSAEFSQKTYRFTTGRKRLPDEKRGETEENIRANNEFNVEFFLPDQRDRLQLHLAVIVNGFNEMRTGPYHNPRQGLCSCLARRGIAAVLLPIPNHMNRKPEDPPYPKDWEPKHLVSSDPDRFYEGYRQEIADIEKLTSLVHGYSPEKGIFGDGTRFVDCFSEETRVHLIGYSIGGLATLSAFLRSYVQYKEGIATPRYDSCVLLCSGANFETLHPEEIIGISEDAWKKIKHHYLGKAYEKDEEKKSLSNRIFEMVLLGGRREEFYDHMRELSNRILIVIGASDDVSSPEAVLDLEPEETGLAIIKVPGLDHPLASKSWAGWRNWILDCIASFAHEHPDRVVKDDSYWRAALRRSIRSASRTMKTKVIRPLLTQVDDLMSRSRRESSD